ncbi:cytochrome P450, partial [Cunninghamella echinulata]
GDAHRQQRKMLNPAFSIQAIREMTHLMMIPGVQLRNSWMDQIMKNNEKNGNSNQPTEIIVSKGLSLATLDVIGEAGFGHSFESIKTADTPQQNKLSKAYMDIFDTKASLMRILQFFFPVLEYLPTQRNLDIKQDLKWLNEESEKLIQDGLERIKREERSNKENDDGKGDDTLYQQKKRSKDLLTLMSKEIDQETGSGMSIKELQNQCLTFLAAGHETTSTSLSWTLWLLAKNPDIQEALRQEIEPLFQPMDFNHELFSNPSQVDHTQAKIEAKIPTYDEINKLPLLNNVCKESLRLIPPVPVTNRLATKDDVVGPHFIPKGTVIFFSPMCNHHDEKVWGEDVLEFNPDRWNHAPAKNTTAYDYAPFLYPSPRTCIGNRFAMIEMKVLLCILIKDLKFTEKEGFTPKQKQQITLRPSPNMTLLVEQV